MCGLIAKILRKTKFKKAAFYIAGISCPVLNTILFMGTVVTLFYQTDYIQTLVNNLGAKNPLGFIVALVVAYKDGNLFKVALSACICVFILELFLPVYVN